MKLKFLKHKDLHCFVILMLISYIMGYFIFDKAYNNYSELITFLSIVFGFTITSFSILFNTPLKKVLYDRRIKYYETELHRLRTFYSSALLFSILSISFLLVFYKDFTILINIMEYKLYIAKHNFILPIIVGEIYFLYKLMEDLFRIFVYPTN